jgi:hypothetical protein
LLPLWRQQPLLSVWVCTVARRWLPLHVLLLLVLVLLSTLVKQGHHPSLRSCS